MKTDRRTDVKRIKIFLFGIVATVMLTGCGAMPDLTQEETQLISEYAVGVLLKYDTSNSRRLVDTSAYNEVTVPEEPVEEPEQKPEKDQSEAVPVDDTEVVDVSQDEETMPSTIESYYGIQNITFQYTGYELTDSYPPSDWNGEDGDEQESVFFSMDATDGTQLLVLKFQAINTSGEDIELNMLEHNARFRVSVNGEPGKGALATMLLNDMQTYDDIIAAGASTELISIVEIPQGTNVDTIDFILRGNNENATLTLE